MGKRQVKSSRKKTDNDTSKTKRTKKRTRRTGFWGYVVLGSAFAALGLGMLQLVGYFRWMAALEETNDAGVKVGPRIEEQQIVENDDSDESDLALMMPSKNQDIQSVLEPLELIQGDLVGLDGVRKKTWVRVTDDMVEAWFKDIPTRLESEDGMDIGYKQISLTGMGSLVAKTIQEIHQECDKVIMNLFETSFDDILDESPEDSSTASSTMTSNNDDSDEHNELKERRDVIDKETTCIRWKHVRKLRDRLAMQKRMYSLSELVPSSHVMIWRHVFSNFDKETDGFVFEDSSSASESLDTTTVQRFLVLPWTFQASLLTLPLNMLTEKNLKYSVAFSRLPVDLSSSILLARRQDQIKAFNDYFQAHHCDGASLGIKPYSYDISGDKKACEEMFGRFSDHSEMSVPWLVKTYGTLNCPEQQGNGPCIEAQQGPQIIRGITALRKRYGKCQVQGTVPLVIERAVLNPLLIHSRRFKLQIPLLIVGGADGWSAYWNKGFITLASDAARTDTVQSYCGTAVSSTPILERETTDLRRQTTQDKEVPIWDYKRFERYLSTYENNDSQRVWERVEKITRLIVEMAFARQLSQFPEIEQPEKVLAFQIFRLSFWVDNDFNAIFHRSSADLSLLLDYYKDSSNLERSLFQLLKQAVEIVINPRSVAGDWRLVKDQYQDQCNSTKNVAKYDPCKEIEPIHFHEEEKGGHSNATKREASELYVGHATKKSNEEKQQEKTTNGLAVGEDVRILSPNEERKSPKQPLNGERRGEHIPVTDM